MFIDVHSACTRDLKTKKKGVDSGRFVINNRRVYNMDKNALVWIVEWTHVSRGPARGHHCLTNVITGVGSNQGGGLQCKENKQRGYHDFDNSLLFWVLNVRWFENEIWSQIESCILKQPWHGEQRKGWKEQEQIKLVSCSQNECVAPKMRVNSCKWEAQEAHRGERIQLWEADTDRGDPTNQQNKVKAQLIK